MTHKFTIDDFTRSLSGNHPEFDKALEAQNRGLGPDFFKFVEGILDNTMAEIRDTSPKKRRHAPVLRRKVRRGVGSY